MDIGTTVSRFSKVAYEALRDTFVAKITDVPQLPRVDMFEKCYNLSGFVYQLPIISWGNFLSCICLPFLIYLLLETSSKEKYRLRLIWLLDLWDLVPIIAKFIRSFCQVTPCLGLNLNCNCKWFWQYFHFIIIIIIPITYIPCTITTKLITIPIIIPTTIPTTTTATSTATIPVSITTIPMSKKFTPVIITIIRVIIILKIITTTGIIALSIIITITRKFKLTRAATLKITNNKRVIMIRPYNNIYKHTITIINKYRFINWVLYIDMNLSMTPHQLSHYYCIVIILN
ncbi:protein aspartic protease in guard cell 2 [Quercus suber]|uniref:Protein aspartic protease in guard cell 2 n=1 Tax=Quercus suber TaxID=58331 RepID=A0AAW0LEM4_QUESU